ncbi:hypothetical protein BD779DRAFT_1544835 [Infundibulicybe gibba]|nr:hypothetical protein BD779DRAFT_1544835 [Infundibulicybe gibba]
MTYLHLCSSPVVKRRSLFDSRAREATGHLGPRTPAAPLLHHHREPPSGPHAHYAFKFPSMRPSRRHTVMRSGAIEQYSRLRSRLDHIHTWPQR